MSLLMDALKKAEEAKRQGAGQPASPAGDGELSLEPLNNLPSGSPLPDLHDHLDMVNADLQAVANHHAATVDPRVTAPSAAPAVPPPGEAERQSARNVFAAKMAAGDEASTNKTMLIAVIGGTVLALAGIGGYFWYQLQGMSGNSLTRPPEANARPAPLQPFPAKTSSPSELPSAAPAAPVLPKPSALPEASAPAPSRQHTEVAPPPEEPPSPIRLSRGKPAQNPTLDRAYEALQNQDFGTATQDYEKVLRADPKNTDALLGLATIANHGGQTERAQALYLRALEADPKNPVAQAGVIALLGQATPQQSESRLKMILATQPEAAQVHFALGNLYARQGRWSEAQQAYFKALTSDGDNPDYLFNLAVSLDHLHQDKLAGQYYQNAITAASSRAAAFDQDQVRRRIQELQP